MISRSKIATTGRLRVAVVTPTKNRVAMLREAVESVRAQDFQDWEHIIVDDGSSDGTDKEIARWARADPRIRYIRRETEPVGANACRNIGVRMARADLIVFLDSDDLLAPHCLTRRVTAMDRNADCDFITFQSSLFLDKPGDLRRVQDTDLLEGDLLRFLYFEIPWIISAPIWRRATLERLGLFDESLPSWQDVELHIRALTAGCQYLRFPDVDHHIRRKADPAKISTLQRHSPQHLSAASSIIEKFEQMVREGPGMTWVRQRALCSLYFFVAERWVETGHLSEAVVFWGKAHRRGLAPSHLYMFGAAILRLQAVGVRSLVGRRIGHKWAGWARLRHNAELVEP